MAEAWPPPRKWTPPDLKKLTRPELEAQLRTEEAANYWLSYGITAWAARAKAALDAIGLSEGRADRCECGHNEAAHLNAVEETGECHRCDCDDFVRIERGGA